MGCGRGRAGASAARRPKGSPARSLNASVALCPDAPMPRCLDASMPRCTLPTPPPPRLPPAQLASAPTVLQQRHSTLTIVGNPGDPRGLAFRHYLAGALELRAPPPNERQLDESRKKKLAQLVPFEMRAILVEMLDCEPNLRPSANYILQVSGAASKSGRRDIIIGAGASH